MNEWIIIITTVSDQLRISTTNNIRFPEDEPQFEPWCLQQMVNNLPHSLIDQNDASAFPPDFFVSNWQALTTISAAVASSPASCSPEDITRISAIYSNMMTESRRNQWPQSAAAGPVASSALTAYAATKDVGARQTQLFA